ncbi:unnamed protein product [Urochloa decumbens]|uniref:RING-type E3 ubiquitin transferase n=1 Tax=Urochloa decumbens TaxID=240449 RepID=A0ABC9DYF2_9POAL
MDGAVTPPPPPAVASAIERKLSPGVVLLIAILAMVFFIIGLLNLLIQNLLRLRRARRRRRQVGDLADGSSPTAFQGQLGELFHLHDAGVDQASIDALPVFQYRAVAAGDGGTGNGKGPFDCAVCLCEFAGDDKLRLLPTCGHAFHVPCIDAWLLSHSTCPLCRGSILAECSPPSSPSAPLALEAERAPETVVGHSGGDPGDRDGEEATMDAAEEIVEVKLGKLRCVDGNAVSASSRDLAGGGDGSNGRGSLGQRRCLSMGSYEYVMDDHAALRVTVPKRRAASSRSRRRHALSECDFGGSSKKGAWEAAVTEAAAGRCGGGGGAAAASLNRDSFSTSKIWMVPAARREEGGRRRADESAGQRRAASFRWPAMSAGGKKQHRGGGGEASWDVEAAGDGAPAPAEERPSSARAAMLWVAGGRQGSHS